MGDDISLQFSKGDEEIAEIFGDIGLKRNTSRVLVLMLKDADVTSRDVERICDLRQPEVSIALKDLIVRNWVKDIRYDREGRGRPTVIYHLITSLDKILDQLKRIIVGDYEKKLQEIEQIREMLREKVKEGNN